MSVIWWKKEESELLKKLYPTESRETIIKALKNKTWYAIQKEAKGLGLERSHKAKYPGRPKKKLRTSVTKKELQTLFLKNQELTVYEIAVKLNTTAEVVRRCMFRYGL
jgi:hypothetical protein